ncbi:MAG: hypothetical protein ACRCV0_02585 [Brevinema sp.]
MKFYPLLIILFFRACTDKQSLSEIQAESVLLETNTNTNFFIPRTNIADCINTMSDYELIYFQTNQLYYSLDDIEIRDRLIEIEQKHFYKFYIVIYHDPKENKFYFGEIDLDNSDKPLLIFVSYINIHEKLYTDPKTQSFYTQHIRYLDDSLLQSYIPDYGLDISYDKELKIIKFFSNQNPITSNQAPVLYISVDGKNTTNTNFRWRYFLSDYTIENVTND